MGLCPTAGQNRTERTEVLKRGRERDAAWESDLESRVLNTAPCAHLCESEWAKAGTRTIWQATRRHTKTEQTPLTQLALTDCWFLRFLSSVKKCGHLRVKWSFHAKQPSSLVKHKPVIQTNTALYLQDSSDSRERLVDLQNMSLQLAIKMTKGSNNHTITTPPSIQNLDRKETRWQEQLYDVFAFKQGPEDIFLISLLLW